MAKDILLMVALTVFYLLRLTAVFKNFIKKRLGIALLIAFFVVSIFPLCACNKAPGTDRPVAPPEAPKDSVASIPGKWKVIQDSVSNIGDYYFVEGGRTYVPTPGVYYGQDADFWEFQADGNFTVHENNQTYTLAYQLDGSKLIFPGQAPLDTATIVTLTASDAAFEWKQTSPNGGRYFRKTSLKK